LTGEITGFAYKDGTLKPFQTISMLPEGFTGEIGAADIHVSPDGKFLYASNRGDANDISIYSVDLKTGRLALVGHKSTLGKAPRNFTIDPSGNFLLVANQNSNNVIVFKRNAKTGLLDDTGKRIDVGKPVCLVFSKID
jgi:6-phosphogluconolactonase